MLVNDDMEASDAQDGIDGEDIKDNVEEFEETLPKWRTKTLFLLKIEAQYYIPQNGLSYDGFVTRREVELAAAVIHDTSD
ncbi:hypothetical protein L1987_23819 [Smallanthus sonchifolius]|uniref:Uncharacterized protein n=1 Tax=Smallanthus sonchifolius TaxID=185202 RepID=A0ACB9IJK8_9ASTR|nr:hypothetical protein L1987_23819 [Smallanthus sonchifolius]